MYDLGTLGVVALVVVSLGCSDAFLFDDDCAGEPYDKETEICCADVKYSKGPYVKCCAGTMIDTRASTCGLGIIFHNSERGCNGVYYSKDEQLCCGDELTKKDPNVECCHGKLMDIRASYCDWGMIINKDENGCDNVYYKREEQVCCNYKLYPNTKYTECCSGHIIDTRAAVCLYGLVVNTRNGCDGKFFDTETEFCCNDEVHTKDSTHSCCGGKTVYDPSKLSCDVSGVILPHSN